MIENKEYDEIFNNCSGNITLVFNDLAFITLEFDTFYKLNTFITNFENSIKILNIKYDFEIDNTSNDKNKDKIEKFILVISFNYKNIDKNNLIKFIKFSQENPLPQIL